MTDSGDKLSRRAFVIARKLVQGRCAMDEQAHISYHQNDFFGAITASSFRFGVAPENAAAAAV